METDRTGEYSETKSYCTKSYFDILCYKTKVPQHKTDANEFLVMPKYGWK